MLAGKYFKKINCTSIGPGQGDGADSAPLGELGVPTMNNMIWDLND